MNNLLNNLNETIDSYNNYQCRHISIIYLAFATYIIFCLFTSKHISILAIRYDAIVLFSLFLFDVINRLYQHKYKANVIKFEQNCQKIADQYPNMIVLNSYDDNDLNILLTKKPLNQQKLNEYSNGVKIARSDSQIIIKISNENNTQPNSYKLPDYRNLKNQSTKNLKKAYLKWF